MFQSESNSRWHIGLSFTESVDFCIYVLEIDGLQITPFDKHPTRIGQLQTHGLNAETWNQWLQKVVDLQLQKKQHVASTGNLPPRELNIKAHNPVNAWTGVSSIFQILDNLWQQYNTISDKRKELQEQLQRVLNSEEVSRIWHDLEPYHQKIAPIQCFLVSYQTRVEYAIPPSSALVSVGKEHFSITSLRDQLLRVAEKLVYTSSERTDEGDQIVE